MELPLERSYQSAQLAEPLSWLLDSADSATVLLNNKPTGRLCGVGCVLRIHTLLHCAVLSNQPPGWRGPGNAAFDEHLFERLRLNAFLKTRGEVDIPPHLRGRLEPAAWRAFIKALDRRATDRGGGCYLGCLQTSTVLSPARSAESNALAEQVAGEHASALGVIHFELKDWKQVTWRPEEEVVRVVPGPKEGDFPVTRRCIVPGRWESVVWKVLLLRWPPCGGPPPPPEWQLANAAGEPTQTPPAPVTAVRD